MVHQRGRPILPMPVHPERVISRAVKAGLSATIVLQRNISNNITREYYDRSYERWNIRQRVYQITKEQGKPDFSHISKAEAPIRDDTRLMLYENAAKYGFTASTRQKKTDDSVDPLNQRFNACGRVVRESSEIMFPIPNPMDFGTYSRRDGGGTNKYRRAGYERSSFGPKVILAHPDLPSLDFGDAARSHNEYLAAFCAIHNVSVTETTKYSHLFHLLVRPYLEYLYSEFKCGKPNFQKGLNWALRQVKELVLDAGFQPTLNEKKTVTDKLDYEGLNKEKENKRFFKIQETEAKMFYGDHPAVVELNRLRGNLDEDESSEGNSKEDSIFTTKDVEHLRNNVARRSRIAGSIMHRRLSVLFPSPWHLNDVVLSGDRYVRSSDYIIIAEVPIQSKFGAGKVDLILCERTISEDGKQVLWRPVFVLEIKTRLGQSWHFDADYKDSEVRPRGSHLQRIVPVFPLSDYPLDDDQWNAIVRSTPTSTARDQLEIYCQAVAELYTNTTQQDVGHILRGVVVIESSSDINELRKVLEQLIIHSYESVKSSAQKLRRTVITPAEIDDCRIALVLDEQSVPKRENGESVKVPWVPVYNPFKTRKNTKRHFLLYLAGNPPTSAGQSAAWNAIYYHGLQMFYEMKEIDETTEFVWMDLANQFNEPRLAEARLRLRPRRYSEEEVAKVQPSHIREFFEGIKVKGYLDGILTFLYREGGLPSFRLKKRKNKRRVVIVSGADTLRDATPQSHKERLSLLIDHLLSSLPDDEMTTVVWFDTPVPSVEKAIPYSSRSLLPYHETSSLGEIVTEIVWNLPIAPRGALQPEKWKLPVIGDSPMHDDIRVIVRHTSTDFKMELTHVPFLRGWSKRFRNKGTGLITREQEIDDIVPDRALRQRMKLLSLTMIPWLVKLWPKETLVEDSAETLEEQFAQLDTEFRGGNEPLTVTRTTQTGPISKAPSLLELVRFRLPDTMDARSFQEMTTGKIKSQRLYRSPRRLKTRPLQQVPAPRVEEEVVDLESEQPGHEWLFGIKFAGDSDEQVPWWIVIQDPVCPSRMLAGCFTDRLPDKDGFLWAESRQELVNQSSLEDILGFNNILIIGRKMGAGIEIWSSTDSKHPIQEGLLEVRGQGRSTVGHLRAIRQTSIVETTDGPSSTVQPSEAFYSRMVDSLRRHLTTVTSPAPVILRLKMEDNLCQVSIMNEDEEVVQRTPVEYTADLISLLRWPMTKGGPMFTDSGEYVTWSVFDGIDYGELDFINPYVTYTAARKAPRELPKRVSQFFEEAEELAVSVEHDPRVCPMVQGEGGGHRACWRITLPSSCPVTVKKQLDRHLTGEEVNGLLSPGRILAGGRLYTFAITPPPVSELDESIVFHEERYIRILLRSLGLQLKPLSPGTFLEVEDQQWAISITWDGRHLKWEAQSTVSGLKFMGGTHTVELVHGTSAREECERILDSITSLIPEDEIERYPELEEEVMFSLRSLGYSKSSPPCELRIIESTESVFSYGVYLRRGNSGEALATFIIDAVCSLHPDSIIEMVDLGPFNIRNKRSFMRRLTSWVNRNVPSEEEGEEGEEVDEWEVTLFINTGSCAVHWEATEGNSKEYRSGLLYDDPKVLLDGIVEEAEKVVRVAFEGDVVSELKHISNLEEVLEEQVPVIIQELRQPRE